MEGIYSRFVQNVKIVEPTFSTRRDASGRGREHAQYVTSLKIHFRPRLTAVASRILKSLLLPVSFTMQTMIKTSQLLAGIQGRLLQHFPEVTWGFIPCTPLISVLLNMGIYYAPFHLWKLRPETDIGISLHAIPPLFRIPRCHPWCE